MYSPVRKEAELLPTFFRRHIFNLTNQETPIRVYYDVAFFPDHNNVYFYRGEKK